MGLGFESDGDVNRDLEGVDGFRRGEGIHRILSCSSSFLLSNSTVFFSFVLLLPFLSK